jgi:DMSO/TMAO reductase YedYZ molybdopterin-dependent catalytic subunit
MLSWSTSNIAQESVMKTAALLWLSLLLLSASLTGCSENPPAVDWELAIDGDVDQPVTYSFEELVELRRAELTDIQTRDPDNPDEETSWEGVTLFLLLQDPGGVEYTVNSWVMVTLVDGTTRRANLSDLRGAIIALKDGAGNWLAEQDVAPVRLIAPNRPSSEWWAGPVRITVHSD